MSDGKEGDGGVTVLGTGAHGAVLMGVKSGEWVTKVAVRPVRMSDPTGDMVTLATEWDNYSYAKEKLKTTSGVLLDCEQGDVLSENDRKRYMSVVANTTHTSLGTLEYRDTESPIIHVQKADGDLFQLGDALDLAQNENGPNLHTVLLSFRAIIEAVCELSEHMYHGDIRPENIMYRQTESSLAFYLGDWGAAHVKTGGHIQPHYLASMVTPPERAAKGRAAIYIQGMSDLIKKYCEIFHVDDNDHSVRGMFYRGLTKHYNKWGSTADKVCGSTDLAGYDPDGSKYDAYGLGACLLFCVCIFANLDLYVMRTVRWDASAIGKMQALAFRCMSPDARTRPSPKEMLEEFDRILPRVIGRGRYGCVVAPSWYDPGWVTKVYTGGSDEAKDEYDREMEALAALAPRSEMKGRLVGRAHGNIIGALTCACSGRVPLETLVAESIIIISKLEVGVDIRLEQLPGDKQYLKVAEIRGIYQETATGKMYIYINGAPKAAAGANAITIDANDKFRLYTMKDANNEQRTFMLSSNSIKYDIGHGGTVKLKLYIQEYDNTADWVKDVCTHGVWAVEYENGGIPTDSPQVVFKHCSDVVHLMSEVVRCLAGLAQAGWAHRDLHAGNLLVHPRNPSAPPRLIDFGMADLYSSLYDPEKKPTLFSPHLDPPELFEYHEKDKDTRDGKINANFELLATLARNMWGEGMVDQELQTIRDKTVILLSTAADDGRRAKIAVTRSVDLYRAGYLLLGYLSRVVDKNQDPGRMGSLVQLAFDMLDPDVLTRPTFENVMDRLSPPPKEGYAVHRCGRLRRRGRGELG